MGCSPSHVNPQGNEATTPRPMPTDRKANGHMKNGQVKKTDSNANQKDINTNNPGMLYLGLVTFKIVIFFISLLQNIPQLTFATFTIQQNYNNSTVHICQ